MLPVDGWNTVGWGGGWGGEREVEGFLKAIIINNRIEQKEKL